MILVQGLQRVGGDLQVVRRVLNLLELSMENVLPDVGVVVGVLPVGRGQLRTMSAWQIESPAMVTTTLIWSGGRVAASAHSKNFPPQTDGHC